MTEKGIMWRTFRDRYHSLKRLHMKIRPVDYKSQGEDRFYYCYPESNRRKIYIAVSVGIWEEDTDYYGHDLTSGVLNGVDNLQPDAESCRSSCRSKGAKHFSWKPNSNECWCKTSDSGRTGAQGAVSGDVGGGEMDPTL